jgi:hypothetical protein
VKIVRVTLPKHSISSVSGGGVLLPSTKEIVRAVGGANVAFAI